MLGSHSWKVPCVAARFSASGVRFNPCRCGTARLRLAPYPRVRGNRRYGAGSALAWSRRISRHNDGTRPRALFHEQRSRLAPPWSHRRLWRRPPNERAARGRLFFCRRVHLESISTFSNMSVVPASSVLQQPIGCLWSFTLGRVFDRLLGGVLFAEYRPLSRPVGRRNTTSQKELRNVRI